MTFNKLIRQLALTFLFLAIIATIPVITSDAYSQSQKLESEAVEITTKRGKFAFEIEIADQPEERTIGLMNRDKLDPRGGMLFVFDRPQIIQMWMKNTLIPLDMVFINVNGSVVSVAERTVPHSLAVVSSGQKASYVLELAGGMASFIGLQPGDMLKHNLFVAE